MRRRLLVMAPLLAAGLALGFTARAADYPSKPIKLIIPYKPGGGSDVIMRAAAMHLEAFLGEKMPVVNVDGAGGAVGWTQAAKAKPDGYTVTQLTNAMIVREATKSANVSIRDFAPVANIGLVALTVTAKGDGPYKTLKDLYEASKARPGEVGLAMGVGTPAQFVAAQVEKVFSTDLKLVNAGGGADKMAAVLGGHVDALIEPVSGVVAQHESGLLRILAVLSDKRLAFLPDVPTAKEQGFDLMAGLFYGFGAPKGTPQKDIDTLAAAIEKLGGNAEYQAQLKKIKFDWHFLAATEFGKLIDAEHKTTMELGKELGF
ncbi:MAG: tripartite tricarboxylate transporter substrate binding protein [Rhodospirillales bacterium]|nr:tripartite tricarboxylate transporter substrate binding protein [Rhodospirillales bacterium]